MIRNFLIAICILFFLALLSNNVHACVCYFQSLKDNFSSSDVVFIGRVVKNTTVKYANVSMTLKESGTLELVKNPKWKKTIKKLRRVTFEISEPFKGTTGKIFTLSSSYYTGNGSCGIPFDKGKNYLIFADKTQSLLSKEESEQPKENWTSEMQLNAEADEFNKYLPPFTVNVCSYTGNLLYREKEVKAIRYFQKNGTWGQSEKQIPMRILY